MVSLVVQAGGESRRMGRNKALIPFMGQPLIQRVIERLKPLADEVIITSNQMDGFNEMHIPVVADVLPGLGALGGLYTALWAARNPFVMVVACDMPFANRGLLQYQLDLLVKDNMDVVIPGFAEGWEPFHSVYRKVTCLPHIKGALEQGQKRLISWLPQVKVRYLGAEEIERFDSLGIAFQNVNTLEELDQAEALARMVD
ncbi:MAG TPA: molybdenum cofactor guanylyltransferase [Longilinea sp.]|nr:molybdenum cofactor guanylyltransferase [Longilinea sp.]